MIMKKIRGAYYKEVEKVLRQSFSNKEGLSDKEAISRFDELNPNTLAKDKPYSRLKTFISQFKNPLAYILILAGGVSFLVGEVVDAQVIFLAVIINVIIGFFQEDKANSALEKLKKMVAHNSIVIRGGKKKEVAASDLVIGDILVLRAGELVLADARLIVATDLEVNEASLTGESMPIYKSPEAVAEKTLLAERRSMVYSGTNILSGAGLAVVVAIASDTEIGKISEMVKKADGGPTPLQKKMAEVSKFLGLAVLVVSTLLVIIGLLKGLGLLEVFISAIAVAVASIPEGLAMAVTVILAVGIKQIAKKKALTRKLLAAETLGSITVICSDKTGTLTEGKMSFEEIIINNNNFSLKKLLTQKNNEEFKDAFKAALLCSDVITDAETGKMSGSAIEISFMDAANKLNYKQKDFLYQEPRLAELPFKSARKYMMSLHEDKQNQFFNLYVKGAGEIILSKCSQVKEGDKIIKLNDDKRAEIISSYNKLTSQGLRVIALAYKPLKESPLIQEMKEESWHDISSDLVFMALVSFKDPLRKDSAKTIALCKRAGIRPIIITGDHPNTALAIARELGSDLAKGGVLTGLELDKLSEVELMTALDKVSVFARVSPSHKILIVEALKKKGEVVAMTGDGLNDSPALKAADIGVCLGSGTEVTKETADIVLLDDNFSVIVSAIKQGRVIFGNIRKSLTYLISDCFSEIILIVGSILFNTPLALLPTQILWINIVNDGLPSFSLAFEGGDDDIMNRRPVNKKESVFNREMKAIIIWLGLIRDSILFAIFYYIFKNLDSFGFSVDYLRTLFFATLIVKSLFAVFSLRSFSLPIYKIKQFRNPYLFFAVFSGLAFLILAVYAEPFQRLLKTEALAPEAWIFIVSVALINIIALELIKVIFSHLDAKKEKTN